MIAPFSSHFYPSSTANGPVSSRHWLAALLCLVTSACTSLQSVSVNSVPRDRSRPVSASESNVAFLGIHFDNKFVNALPAKLKAQCPNGKVTGVFTKHEATWYVIVESREVRVSGYCVYEHATPAAGAPSAPPPSPPKSDETAPPEAEPASGARG